MVILPDPVTWNMHHTKLPNTRNPAITLARLHILPSSKMLLRAPATCSLLPPFLPCMGCMHAKCNIRGCHSTQPEDWDIVYYNAVPILNQRHSLQLLVVEFDTCLVWELLLLPSYAQTALNLPTLKGARWRHLRGLISAVWIPSIPNGLLIYLLLLYYCWVWPSLSMTTLSRSDNATWCSLTASKLLNNPICNVAL